MNEKSGDPGEERHMPSPRLRKAMACLCREVSEAGLHNHNMGLCFAPGGSSTLGRWVSQNVKALHSHAIF